MKIVFKIYLLLLLPLLVSANSPLKVNQTNNKLDLVFSFSIDVKKHNIILDNNLVYSIDKYVEIYFPFNVAIPSNQTPYYKLNVVKSKAYDGRLFFLNKQIANGKDIINLNRIDLLRNNWVAYYHITPVFYDSLKNQTVIIEEASLNFLFDEKNTNVINYQDDIIQSTVVNYNQAVNWAIEPKSLKKNSGSIFSNSNFYRFAIKNEGVYIIKANQLADYGIDKNSVDPRTIKIYTMGGAPLNEDFNSEIIYEPKQIPIIVVGEEDGKFDDNDYILFYAQGVDFWQAGKNSNIYRNRNPYAKDNKYLITSGGTQGLRVAKVNSTTGGISINSTKAYLFLEDDKYNLGSTGREFYGDEFNDLTPSKNYLFNFDGIIAGTTINYTINFANTLTKGNYQKMRLSLNNNIIGESSYLYGVVEDYFYGSNNKLNFTSISNGTTSNVLQLRLVPGKSSVGGYLNFIEIEYVRDLNATNDQIMIFTKDTTAKLNYNIKNFSNSFIKIFDVTDNFDIREIVPNQISGGEANFSIDVTNGKIRKILCLTKDKYLSPPKGEKISFTDIKSETNGKSYIIITHKNFKTQADRLKQFKETESRFPISTMVVDVEDIINEFGNGSNDPTAIRNYLKWAYENFTTKPQYVLFFGDCTYDYRNLEGKSNNYVPTYQLDYSLDIIYSWATDDYFCNIVGNTNINSMVIDLIPGRIPCRTAEEAKSVVDKIIAYDKKIIPGQWKNTITLVSDDHYRPGNPDDGGSEFEFTYQSEQLSESIIPPLFSINKLYSIRYPFENTSLGRRRPTVNQAIIDAINNGTLIVNYIGHGSPDLWADEQIFDISIGLAQMKNDKLFFLCAATCDFGYFDYVDKQSGAEKLLLNDKYGMIAGIAFNRPVFGNDNAVILYFLFDSLFRYDKNINGYQNYKKSAGMGVFLLKQVKVGFATQKLIYFGDPTLVLQVPRYYVQIDSINGKASNSNVVISALQNVKINATSSYISNGIAQTTVLDSYKEEYIAPMNIYIKDKGGTLYSGKTSIKNGKIEDKFIVPKDISYSGKNGKLFVYCYDENKNIDGIGVLTNFKVDGLDTSKVYDDKKGPNIEIFFDNIGNSQGRITNKNVKLLIKLQDESGINTTGLGLGHRLEAILNDEEKNSIDLSQYYVSDIDSYGKSGMIEYNLSNLKLGKNKIKVVAWDILNNFTAKEIDFFVVADNSTVINELYNYPNPFNSSTYFVFQHNLSSTVNVEVKIYTIAGRCIKTIKKYGLTERYVKVYWDGKDENYNNIANGVYFYKVKVSTVGGDQTAEKIGKLSIIK